MQLITALALASLAALGVAQGDNNGMPTHRELLKQIDDWWAAHPDLAPPSNNPLPARSPASRASGSNSSRRSARI
jgi:hypothetical protein